MTQSHIIRRTGTAVAFLDVHIGSPFFAHGSLWVRTGFDCATKLEPTPTGPGWLPSSCNFLIDGTVEPARGPYGHAGEVCEEVEALELIPTESET